MTELLTPNPAQVLTLSPSRLTSYNGCGRKYELAYVQQVPQVRTGPMIIGTAVHEAIAHAEPRALWRDKDAARYDAELKQGGDLARVFVASLDRQIEEAGGEALIRWGGRKSGKYPNGEDYRWALGVGPMMLRCYCDVRQADQEVGLRVPDELVEFKVSATLDTPSGPVLVRGYVDLMVLFGDDGFGIVRDWKTGSFTDVVQLASYAWMITETLGIPVELGQFIKLRPNAKKRIIDHDLSTLVPVVPELYKAAKANIEAGVFTMNPSSFCKSCTVKEFCAWGSALPADDLPDD